MAAARDHSAPAREYAKMPLPRPLRPRRAPGWGGFLAFLALAGCSSSDEAPANQATGGAPGVTCSPGQTACGPACVDTQSNSAHCGACGAACVPGQQCLAGACACPQPLTLCGAACSNLEGDGQNCGVCGTACTGGTVCSAGACQASCTVAGQTQCGASCVDLQSDVANCGQCGAPCAGGTCVAGACTCPAGQLLCGGACTDVTANSAHCGGCDVACTGATTCANGACVGTSTGGTGGAGTGGVSGGGTGGTGTGGGACTNIRPTGTEWDAATCDQWATQTSECSAAWMIDNDYCNESCGRCTAAGTGGVGTGGAGGTGGATGGSGGTGSPVFHVFLLLGQSNMEGYPKAQAADRTEDTRIRVLGYDNCGATGRQTDQWDTAAPPLHSCWNDAIGPGDYFAKTLVGSIAPGDSIGLVPCAISGERIETFMKVGGTKYTWIVNRARLAQQAGGVIEGILFHQGESNNGDPSWPGKVNTLVTDLRTDLGLGNVPLLAGELLYSGSCAGHNTLVNQLPSVVSNAYVVSASGLVEDPTDADWNLHFSHDSQVTLGQRYGQKMLEALGW